MYILILLPNYKTMSRYLCLIMLGIFLSTSLLTEQADGPLDVKLITIAYNRVLGHSVKNVFQNARNFKTTVVFISKVNHIKFMG